jgi:hypothetical protein
MMKILSEPIQIFKGSNVNATVETWAKQTLDALRDRSPTSVWVTHKALTMARDMRLQEVFEMEMGLAQAYCVRRFDLDLYLSRRLPGRYADYYVFIALHGHMACRASFQVTLSKA